MSVIETTSPLAGLPPDLPDEIDQAEPPARTPKKVKRPNLKAALLAAIDDENLARNYDTDVLNTLGQKVLHEYELDERSRTQWVEDSNKAMQLAQQITTPKTTPWPNASNIVFPGIGVATLQFAARTYGAVIQGKGVVKGQTWGDDKGTPATVDGTPDGAPKQQPGPDGKPEPVWLVAPGEKRKTADRIAEFMSWQLLVDIPYWEPELDQLLHQIPVVGGAAKKTYWNRLEERPDSLFVSLMNLVWSRDAASFEVAPRVSEKLWLYPYQIAEYEAEDADERGEGVFLPCTYGEGTTVGSTDTPTGFDLDTGDQQTHDQSDPEGPVLFIEQHTRYDLDGDGYDEPLIVTVHHLSGTVVRIKARYEEDGIKMGKDGKVLKIAPLDYYTILPFMPALDGGSYPCGWGQLLRHLNEGINTTLNQMFDAGTLANSNTGFLASGMGMASGQVSLDMGRWKRLDTRGQSLRDSVMRMPFEGPSPVLFQLLGLLVGAMEKTAGTQDILTGDAAKANAPPTTVLALIEQGLTLYTAIIKRLFRGLAAEFAKIHALNKRHIKDRRVFAVGDEQREISPDDFRLSGGVLPIADPNQMTDMQRGARASALMQFKDDPLVDQTELRRRYLSALNIERIDDLLVPPSPMGAMAAQMEMATKQAELGAIRAREQKDTTQAFLNMALAKKNSTAGEEAWIDAQLVYLRLQIEAVNATTRAAAIDHSFHDTNVQAAVAHARLAADQAANAVGGGGAAPTPGPAGPFPAGPGGALPVPGNPGAGIPPVAAQPHNSGLPPLSAGPGGQPAGGLPGPVGGGGPDT